MIPNRRLKDNAKASVDRKPTGKNHFNVLKASVRALPVFATCLPLRDATELTVASIRKNAANPNPEWGENAIKHCAAAGFGGVGNFVTALQHTGWRRRSIFLSIRWEQMAEIRVQREQFTPETRNLAMMVKTGLALALSLACISAAESPANYRTYGNARIEDNAVLLAHYDRAVQKCGAEARTLPRGNSDLSTLHYNAALRACLYRQGYFDRGAYAYPATLIFDHFFDR